MNTTVSANRSQAWFRPGLYVPVRHIAGIEVLPHTRGGVRVAKTTIHGTAPELRQLADALLRAADRVDRPAVRLRRAA